MRSSNLGVIGIKKSKTRAPQYTVDDLKATELIMSISWGLDFLCTVDLKKRPWPHFFSKRRKSEQ